MRLLTPFVRLLRRYEGFPLELLEGLDDTDPDERIPAATMHELLRGAVEITGDPDLGLKAAREITQGDYGALEYAAASAATFGDALCVVARYTALVNDALEFTFELDADPVVIRVDNALVLPRAAEDFELAAFSVAASLRNPGGLPTAPEVHFMHPEPEDTSEYAITFPNATVRFSQPVCAYVLTRDYFDRPLPAADPNLHRVIRKHADQLLAELPASESFTSRVRDLLMKELSGGNPSAPHIAQQLHISSRTLTRRLEQERTSFKELLDDLRRALALRYVGHTDLALSEIAFLLGFSQVAAFHRAFKRWTEQTPMEHRRERRG
ncbi:MAG: AraC family transcriptional regulator [Myxococcales bacterium]|nr:AraC family transcriptional regulator [Myxococcales bacterium]